MTLFAYIIFIIILEFDNSHEKENQTWFKNVGLQNYRCDSILQKYSRSALDIFCLDGALVISTGP